MVSLLELRDEAKKVVEEYLVKKNIDCKVEIEIPDKFGDFAFSCFSLAPLLKKAPAEIASEMALNISSESFSEIKAIGPYVNFHICAKFLKEVLDSILDKKNDFGNFPKKNEKIVLEHTSANPTGPLHVGRARNPIIGDTLARILKRYGYDLKIDYFVNDVGKQMAMLIWGINRYSPKSSTYSDYVKCYQSAYKDIKENPELEEEIREIMRGYESGDIEKKKAGKEYVKTMLGGIINSLEIFNVNFDNFVWESSFIDDNSVNDIVEKLKPYLEEEEGAYYIDLNRWNIDDKVFISRKDGTSLYFTRDLAYHISKSKRGDSVLNVMGEDHKSHAKILKLVLTDILGIESEIDTVFYSFVSLPAGKMSTRSGNVVYLDDLVNEAIIRAEKEVKKRRDLYDNKLKEIAKIVGTGAIRYNIIRVQPEKSMVFKWEDALNFEGESAPFIQYSHARASSILRKAGWDGSYDASNIKEEGEFKLLKKLGMFPLILEYTANSKRPHILARYAYEVAAEFNRFYRDYTVLKADDEIRNARLAIVSATKIVIKNVLDTLGIIAPEEM